jgi:hypothetical protein
LLGGGWGGDWLFGDIGSGRWLREAGRLRDRFRSGLFSWRDAQGVGVPAGEFELTRTAGEAVGNDRDQQGRDDQRYSSGDWMLDAHLRLRRSDATKVTQQPSNPATQ